MLDDLKAEVSFDKYLVFLLGLGFSKEDVAQLTEVSTQTVYNAIKRNEDKLLEWGVDIPTSGVLEENEQSV